MLHIPCPYCGPRDETEFHYGGESHIAYPDTATVNDADWAHFVFYRANPKGWLAERWVHSAGCRRWFNVWRNTANHAFGPAYKMGDPMPKKPE